MIASDKKYRNLIVVWNNYPDDYLERLAALPHVKYACYGKEKCPTTGTPHIQGYVEFSDPVLGSTIKAKCPKTHFERRMGPAHKAADYCKKDGDFTEIGSLSRQGKRTDIELVREQLQQGDTTMRDVVDSARCNQVVRFAETYLTYHEPKRNFKPIVYWIFGPTGTGKTALAHALAKAHGVDLYVHTEEGKWMQGYDAHTGLLIDDIREHCFTFKRILTILDRYECRVECKGGYRQLLATHIFITSPVLPEKVWKNCEDQQQLIRRIDHILAIKSMATVEVIHTSDHAIPYISQAQWFPQAQGSCQEDDCQPGDQEVCKESDASNEASGEDDSDGSG